MPKYDLDKIKFGTDEGTFERAVGLYESGKVTNFDADMGRYSAVVIGTQPYNVYVDDRYFDHGRCNCYVGQKDILCKHMVAVAIYAIKNGGALMDEEKQTHDEVSFSGRKGVLNEEQLSKTKKAITQTLRYIKPYRGPSRTWFAYQNSLDEGCRRLSAIVSPLPVSEQTAKLLVSLIIRLNKKLCTGGVDDSNGTVGGFAYGIAKILEQYTQLEPKCIRTFEKLIDGDNPFGFEDELIKIYDETR